MVLNIYSLFSFVRRGLYILRSLQKLILLILYSFYLLLTTRWISVLINELLLNLFRFLHHYTFIMYMQYQKEYGKEKHYEILKYQVYVNYLLFEVFQSLLSVIELLKFSSPNSILISSLDFSFSSLEFAKYW